MSKQKNDIPDAEIVHLDELEDECDEVMAEEDKAMVEKESMKSRLKRYGKKAIDIGIGVVIGVGAAVVTGIALSNKDDETDEYEVYEESEDEEEYPGD